MPPLVGRLGEIEQALSALALRHEVPGAVLAVSLGDELFDFATGVSNADTGVETTTDTAFQIGSNTKILTTTLLMQLVDEKKLALDAPVRRYLADFSLADPGGDEITVRQLLVHTSGIEGDYFEGFGRDDEAVARYVDSLAAIGLIHRPGEMWSYCNSGFVVAGRLAEVMTETTYAELVSRRIFEPLGLSQATVRPEEMLRKRCAVGHVTGQSGRLIVPPRVVMEYAQVPAGSMTVMTASELARFTRAHLEGGVLEGGRIVSELSALAMQEALVRRPATSTVPLSQGLGWRLEEWSGKRVVGHGGATIGQFSFLQSVPDEGLVVALLTNAPSGGLLWRDLARYLFPLLAGVEPGVVPKAPSDPPRLDLSIYAGSYERLGVRYEVTAGDGHLLLESEFTGSMAELHRGQKKDPPVVLRPIDAERFAGTVEGLDGVVVFSGFERRRPRYIFTGRVARRRPPRRQRSGRTPRPRPAGRPRAARSARPPRSSL